MKRTPIRTKLLGGLAVAAGVAAGLAVAPAGAHAEYSSAAACKIRGDISYNPSRHTVAAFRMLDCGPNGESTDLPTTLRRDGRTVASGVGLAIYTCRGSAVGTFTATSARPENHPCG